MRQNTLKGKVKIFAYFAAFIFMVVVHVAIDKNSVDKESDNGYAKLNGNSIIAEDSLYDKEEVIQEFISAMKVKSIKLIQKD